MNKNRVLAWVVTVSCLFVWAGSYRVTQADNLPEPTVTERTLDEIISGIRKDFFKGGTPRGSSFQCITGTRALEARLPKNIKIHALNTRPGVVVARFGQVPHVHSFAIAEVIDQGGKSTYYLGELSWSQFKAGAEFPELEAKGWMRVGEAEWKNYTKFMNTRTDVAGPEFRATTLETITAPNSPYKLVLSEELVLMTPEELQVFSERYATLCRKGCFDEEFMHRESLNAVADYKVNVAKIKGTEMVLEQQLRREVENLTAKVMKAEEKLAPFVSDTGDVYTHEGVEAQKELELAEKDLKDAQARLKKVQQSLKEKIFGAQKTATTKLGNAFNEAAKAPCPGGGVVEPPISSPCKNLPKPTLDPAALRGQLFEELRADLHQFSDPLAPQYNPENVGLIRNELVDGRNGIIDLESGLSERGREVRALSRKLPLKEQHAALRQLPSGDQNILRQIFDIEYELNSDQVTAALDDLKRCAPPACVAEEVSAEVAAQIAEAARLSKQLTQAQEALKAARLKHIEYISQFVGGGPEPGMGRGPGMGFAPDQAELQRLKAVVAEAEGRVAQLGERLKPLEEVLVNIPSRSGVVGSAALPKIPVAAEVGATVAGELSWASRLARVATVRESVDFFFELFLGRFTLYGFIIHDLVMWEINYWSNVIDEIYYNDAIRNAELRLVFLETTIIQRWNRYLATLRTEAEIAQCTGLVINTAYDDLLTLYILRGKIHHTFQDIMNISIAYDIQHDEDWKRTLELIEGVIAKKYANFPNDGITGPALEELKAADRERMTNREWARFTARQKIDWLGGGEGMNVVLPENAKMAKYVNEMRRQLTGPPIGDDLWNVVFDGKRNVLVKVIEDAVKDGRVACEKKKVARPPCPDQPPPPASVCLSNNRIPGGFEITDDLGPRRLLQSCGEVRFGALEYRCCDSGPRGQPILACTGFRPEEWPAILNNPNSALRCFGSVSAGTSAPPATGAGGTNGSTSPPPTLQPQRPDASSPAVPSPARQTGVTRSGNPLQFRPGVPLTGEFLGALIRASMRQQ